VLERLIHQQAVNQFRFERAILNFRCCLLLLLLATLAEQHYLTRSAVLAKILLTNGTIAINRNSP
jgi:hypothetical protein